MEVQVKNASKSALFIEHASFNPTSFFTVVDLNKEVSDSHLHSHSILKSIRFLKPGQIHQFLFHLLPTSDLSKVFIFILFLIFISFIIIFILTFFFIIFLLYFINKIKK